MDTPLTLYTYWRSSSSYRVRLALAIKGLAYTPVAVNLLAGAQMDPEYLSKSPAAQVPCLVIDDEPFVESVAIIELLDDLYPEPRLLPADPVGRARVRALTQMINAGIQPLQNRYLLDYLSPIGAIQKSWAQHFIARGLTAYQHELENYSSRGVLGRYSYGDSVTMADLFLVPQLYNARRFRVGLEPLQRLVEIEKAVLATEAARAAMPEAQPDAPAR